MTVLLRFKRCDDRAVICADRNGQTCDSRASLNKWQVADEPRSAVRIRLVGSAPGWDQATERDKALTALTYGVTAVASATVGSDT